MVSTDTEAALAPQSVASRKARPNPGRRRAANAKKRENMANGPKGMAASAAAKPPMSEKDRDGSKTPRSLQTTTAKPKPRVQNLAELKASHSKPIANARTGSERQSAEKASGGAKVAASPVLATPALVTGGLIGCAAGAAMLLGAGLWKGAQGADSAILTVRTARLCMDNLCEEVISSLKAGTYNAPEALDMLRRTTLAYASAIPGGAPVVERIFREIDMIRKQRGHEVDEAVMEIHGDLLRARQSSAGADEMQAIILRNISKLSTFVTNASGDVLARNPKLRPVKEGATKALRSPKVPTVKLNMTVKHCAAVGA